MSRSFVLAVALGGGAISLLMVVQRLSALPLFITSWASSSALILSAPQSRAARPHIVVGAHILCGAIGLLVTAGVADPAMAIVIGFSLSLFVMLLLRMVHPPAAANAAIAATSTAAHGSLMIGWIGGSLCLAALSMLMQALAEDEPQG